eukprot:1400148-Pleurochrysis_carterae.AAC.5
MGSLPQCQDHPSQKRLTLRTNAGAQARCHLRLPTEFQARPPLRSQQAPSCCILATLALEDDSSRNKLAALAGAVVLRAVFGAAGVVEADARPDVWQRWLQVVVAKRLVHNRLQIVRVGSRWEAAPLLKRSEVALQNDCTWHELTALAGAVVRRAIFGPPGVVEAHA